MFKWRYGWKAFGGDMAGGAIAAMIALPYGLAMATLMGLPPMLGVVTSIISGPITFAFGRNSVLIGGTASATVPFIAAAVRQGGIGAAAKVSIVSAIFMLAFGVMRLGRHIRLVPGSVVAGFSCGIGAMMVLSQYDALIGKADWPTATVGVLTLAAALVCARLYPRIPAPLVAVGLAILVVAGFGMTVKRVGAQSLQIPPFAGFSWSPRDIYTVVPSALALAFIASVNILITSRVVDHFRGRHKPMRPTDADGELGAYGIVNICAGLFGAPVSAGIPARSVASLRCGATTRLSNLAHSAFLVFYVLAGGALIAQIPAASLAAITAWTGICLLDWSTWRRLSHMRRSDATAFLATAAAVVFVNAVAAVIIGCAVYGAAMLYARRDSFKSFDELLSFLTPYTPLRRNGNEAMSRASRSV